MRVGLLLSLYWFLCLGGLGLFFPFYSLYLTETAGLGRFQAGVVMAVLPAVSMVAQPCWGLVADRTGKRLLILSLVSLGASFGYTGLLFAEGFVPIVLATGLLAVFSGAVIPGCVSVSLALLAGRDSGAFGRVRVWGTFGYLATVSALPYVLDWSVGPVVEGPRALGEGLHLAIAGAAGFLGLASLVAWWLPEAGEATERAERGQWRELFHISPFRRLLVVLFVAYLCLQGPMALFPVYVGALGGDLHSISSMWAVMLVLEIPLVAGAGRVVDRIGARGLVGMGVLAGAVRWLVCGLTTDLGWVVPVQILHGVAVAGLIVGAPLYVDACVPRELRSSAQGVLAMIGVSLGGILSNVATGWLMQNVGTQTPALLGGGTALALAALVPFVLPAVRGVRPRSI